VRSRNDGVRRRRSRDAALALVCAVALVAGCRKWDNPYDPVGNHPPTVPRYPDPADSSVRTNVGLVLSWHSYDPDSGDTAFFDIFVDTVLPPGLVQAGWTDTTFQPTAVAGSTEYYWCVVAYDNHGDSAVGPVWRFTTSAAVVVTAPDTGAQMRIGSQDTITWTGGPPAGDSIVLYQSADNGVSWNRLGQANLPGHFVWQVPAPSTDSARVKVKFYASLDTFVGTSGRFEIQDTILRR
jgi:hypothetical protein